MNYSTIQSERDWLLEQIKSIPATIDKQRPSDWAELNRYLPPSVTPLPGHYRYDVCPPLREIADCLDMSNPIREVNVMKGAQIGATVGILENAIGYLIDVVKSAPSMMVTADHELAKLRVQSYIVPMIQQSGLEDKISSADRLSSKKAGKTDKKLEWIGGGFLIPIGAQNANKLRSVSIQYLLEDEIDCFPDSVGKNGDPCKLAEARTKAYHNVRKILRLSTPLLKGTSRIEREYLRGDQRRYYVPCRGCGEFQTLTFQGLNDKTGETYGLVWEMDDHNTITPGSVRYKCRFCGYLHRNSDKSIIFPAGEWRATGKPVSHDVRSYHLSALYAPASMYPWEAIAGDWVECWDVYHHRAKDVELLQEFYNNNLGKSFVNYGDGVPFKAVSEHRRHAYKFGEIPNKAHAENYAGGPVLVLTCAVDVHKTNLAVAVFGWTIGGRCYVVDYWRFEGDSEQLDDAGTWLKLSDLIENKVYTADDGKRYRIALTLVDAGWNNDIVCGFCEQYTAAVYPIVGREFSNRNRDIKEFKEFTTTLGTRGFAVMVDLYKDRYAAVLKRRWKGDCLQPNKHFNAPIDITDAQLKELTTENKQPKIDKLTGKRLGYEWHRPPHAKNELWDLIIYNAAALDMIGYDICFNQLGLEFLDWIQFWSLIEKEGSYLE